MRFKQTAAGFLTAITLAIGSPMAATATATPDPAFREQTVEQFIEFWDNNGVSASTQRELVRAIDSGVVPQSMQSGSRPIAADTKVVSGFNRTTETFDDGSIRVDARRRLPEVVASVAPKCGCRGIRPAD